MGISIDEDKRRKTRKDVEPFVKEMGDKMGYAVALDTEDGATDKAYMDAFLVGGIPNAFVIDKSGRIVWQGYPMELDQVLEDVIAGKFDLEAARKADRERRKQAEKDAAIGKLFEQYFGLVSSSKNPEGAEKLGREVMGAIDKNAPALNSFAWNILTGEEVQYRDLKLALQAGKAAYDACKGQDPAIVDTCARALFDNGQVKEAIEQQKKAIELAGDSKEMKTEFEKTLQWYQVAAKKQKP